MMGKRVGPAQGPGLGWRAQAGACPWGAGGLPAIGTGAVTPGWGVGPWAGKGGAPSGWQVQPGAGWQVQPCAGWMGQAGPWWQPTPGGGFAKQYPQGQAGIPYAWSPQYGLVQ